MQLAGMKLDGNYLDEKDDDWKMWSQSRFTTGYNAKLELLNVIQQYKKI